MATCQTPVVFIIFRRPDVTAKVFGQIRLAQPKQLFVIADGPRNEEEALRCQQARAITEQIDWDCEVYRDYSEANLGCRRRVSSGLNWVFEQVNEAIVLEDDCLPSQSFFNFCQSLLDYYRNDTRIWGISGNNFQDGNVRGDGSYYFSRYFHCWGWATWRRAWENYKSDLSDWEQVKQLGLLDLVLENSDEIHYWSQIFNELADKGVPDSWAYRWLYTCWLNSGLTILPNTNLVSNLGFGRNGTHTSDQKSSLANIEAENLLEFRHPTFLVRDKIADLYTFNYVYGGNEIRKKRDIIFRFRSKVSKIINYKFPFPFPFNI
jgi:hypothetical protein